MRTNENAMRTNHNENAMQTNKNVIFILGYHIEYNTRKVVWMGL
jgi:hypothetical protein